MMETEAFCRHGWNMHQAVADNLDFDELLVEAASGNEAATNKAVDGF